VQINNGGVSTYATSGNYGSIDFTKGYPPRETIWNWLSFIGNTESGKIIAVNLVDRFNANMENILWVNGQKQLLSNAKFTLQEPYDKTDWLIENGGWNFKLSSFSAWCQKRECQCIDNEK
jgi:hypothetical protein